MDDLFYTHSLNLGAYIIANGIDPIGKREHENGKKVIYFAKTSELQKIVNNYNNDNEIKKFIGAFRELKSYLFK